MLAVGPTTPTAAATGFTTLRAPEFAIATNLTVSLTGRARSDPLAPGPPRAASPGGDDGRGRERAPRAPGGRRGAVMAGCTGTSPPPPGPSRGSGPGGAGLRDD